MTSPTRPPRRGPAPGRLYLVPNLLGVVPPEDVLPARTMAIAAAPGPLRRREREAGAPVPEDAGHRTAAAADRHRRDRRAAVAAALRGAAAPARAPAAISACCRTPAARASPIPARCWSRPRIARASPWCRWSDRRRPARADGLRHERPGLRLPRLPAGEARGARRRDPPARGGVAADGSAQLFIETPYRNPALLGALVAACQPGTRLCVAADLTTATETVESREIRAWRDRDLSAYAKRPAMFVLQAR